MKYKVGDKVCIRSKEWYDKHKDERGEIVGAFFDKDRAKLCGTIQTIANNGFIDGLGVTIYAVEDAYEFIGEEAIEGLVEEENEKKLSDESWRYKNIFDRSQYPQSFECPEGYIFKDENGNVINATKIALEKKKKDYPKTYEECCKVMNYCCNPVAVKTIHKEELIRKFQFLLMYRDAYWKIAGEEMGLGKPWELSIGIPIYYIYYNRTLGTIKKDYADDIQGNVILAFPTAEMRDAFYENFKELIEQCKELL